MRTLVLTKINLHAKFEVPSFAEFRGYGGDQRFLKKMVTQIVFAFYEAIT